MTPSQRKAMFAGMNKEYHCDICTLKSNVFEMLQDHCHTTKHSFTVVRMN